MTPDQYLNKVFMTPDHLFIRFEAIVEGEGNRTQAVTRLNKLQTSLIPLYKQGKDCLIDLDFDQLIDELTDINFNLIEIADISNDMAATDQGLKLILYYLEERAGQDVPALGLYVLLQPLYARHAAIWDTINDLV